MSLSSYNIYTRLKEARHNPQRLYTRLDDYSRDFNDLAARAAVTGPDAARAVLDLATRLQQLATKMSNICGDADIHREVFTLQMNEKAVRVWQQDVQQEMMECIDGLVNEMPYNESNLKQV